MRGWEDEVGTSFDISPKFTLFGDVRGPNRGSKWVKTCPSPDKSHYKCYFWGIGHTRGWEDMKGISFDIYPKFTLFGERTGAKSGFKMVKTCPSPDKSHYKCYFCGIVHTRGWEDMNVKSFDISLKFPLFWGCTGAKLGVKMGKKLHIPDKSHHKCYSGGI